MFIITSPDSNLKVAIPTGIHELTSDKLAELTKHIELAEHYCVVALVSTIKPTVLCMNLDTKNPPSINLIPLLAKVADNETSYLKDNVGNRLIVDRSSIERGIHCKNNTLAGFSNLSEFLRRDDSLYRSIINGGLVDDNGTSIKNVEFVVLELKIVPTNFISGCYTDEVANDPFRLA